MIWPRIHRLRISLLAGKGEGPENGGQKPARTTRLPIVLPVVVMSDVAVGGLCTLVTTERDLQTSVLHQEGRAYADAAETAASRHAVALRQW